MDFLQVQVQQQCRDGSDSLDNGKRRSSLIQLPEAIASENDQQGFLPNIAKDWKVAKHC